MKNIISKKVNRIALISIAVAALMVCSPLTVFAANSSANDTKTKVVYTGDGTTKSVDVLNANNLNAFENLMPGGTTNPQEIVIQNRSSQKMKVYFCVKPTNAENMAQSSKLLDTLQLEVTFKMDDNSQVQTLYNGPASGKKGTTTVSDVVTNPIMLGYVYGNSESGVISAKLTAPETMGNEFQNAGANIKWILQFELLDPVVISENSVPLAPPTSKIPENPTPLSPATGDTTNFTYVWILAGAVVLTGGVVVVMGIYNKKHRNRQK